MRGVSIGLVAVVAAAASVMLVPGGAGQPATRASYGLVRGVPVLAPWSPPYVERDMPQVVQVRNLRAQRDIYSQLQAAARLPATEANGCVAGSRGKAGPPAPRIFPRVFGHHVEVRFAFPRLPTSSACRPFVVTVVVYSGQKASSTYNNSVEQFRVRRPAGRVALMLPWVGQPPYHVIVNSKTITGRESADVERPLPCPATGDPVAGCLRGYRPAGHSYPMPKPVLPVRGLDRRSLEASFAQVLADEREPPIVRAIPRASRCFSVRLCEVTFADPALPRSPYRVRYAIAGQQLSGCWIGLRGRTINPPPFDEVGRTFIAGCVSWLR